MYFDFIIGYYVFTFQQYFLHKIQHPHYKNKSLNKMVINFLGKHKKKHHMTYDRKNITKIIKQNSLVNNLDLYFYGNIVCILGNTFLFSNNIIIFQIFLAYISYYLHNQYHLQNDTVLHKNCIFIFLKEKHKIHHLSPHKNHFLIDPTFDIIFKTYM